MNNQTKSPLKKKNKKSIAALTLALGLLGPISAASAQQPGPGFGEHAGMGRFEGGLHGLPHGLWWRNPMLVQQIGITPEQQKKMDDILQQSRLQLVDLKANVERQEVLLQPMLDANPPDTAQALGQIDKLVQARADLEKANARMLLGVRAVLTPEQWTKLRAQRNEMRDRMRDHMRMDGDNNFHGHRPDGPAGQRGPGNPPPPPPPPPSE